MFTGLSLAIIVVLGVTVMLLGIVLYAKLNPTSKVAVDLSKVEADIRKVEPAVKADVLKAEIGVDTELGALLAKVELKLTDTAGEDAAISTAQDYLARVTAEVATSVATANAAKQAKLAALQAHVATLQAAATPVTGS